MSLFTATGLGVPVSTTHTITGAIIGVGSTRRLSAVRWGVAQQVIVAWVLFLVIRGMNRVFAQEQAAPPPPAPPSKEQELLAEIRDLLKARA